MSTEQEVVERLNRYVSELAAWLETDEAQSVGRNGKNYVVSLSDVYAEVLYPSDGAEAGDNILHVSPLKATKMTLRAALRFARLAADEATRAGKRNHFNVCVLRDAATKTLYTLKDTLALLDTVRGNMS